MTIRVALQHTTTYRYDRPVQLLPHVIRLRPAPHCRTPILSYALKVEPAEHFLNWQQDPYSNYLARLVFQKPTQELRVAVELTADLAVLNPFDFFIESYAEKVPFRYEATLACEVLPYRETFPAGPKLQALIQQFHGRHMRTIDYLVEINQYLQRAIRYVIRLEPGIQAPEETLELGSGSCRDSAWLLVQLLRHLGLAARFVSGYLIQLTADVKSLDGPSGPTHDFTDLHAWTEVYLPGAGWVGFDPTSGLAAGEGHLPLACSANPLTAAPISGSYEFTKDPAHPDERCHEEFHFSMSVARLHETPRVTKPYTDEQWAAIDALGRQIDRQLQEQDVRLTMGGEPTFVSMDDRDAPEWNFDALGPSKRRQAGQLLRRLSGIFAPGGLLHFGQGKWYPGEALPRWALGCWWRRDGVPAWHDPKLIADDDRDYGQTEVEAQRFVTALAQQLGVDAGCALPAYEDVWHYLWQERLLPSNVDPLQSQLDDPEERRRLARVLEQGLGKTVGYALPLARRGGHWQSGHWFFRTEHMYLIPGDSPMGYRLPLDSLPWAPPEARRQHFERDPFAPVVPFSPATVRTQPRLVNAAGGPGGARPAGPGDNGRPARDVIRTALCVEPRAGRLHVFLPPQDYAEDYLDLVAAVEHTAAALLIPVQLEGYPPPADPRLSHFQITPDPGVLEVNIQPAHRWEELVHYTTTVYAEAHQTRLTAEKFMLDGRAVGTGGGNHIVLGGPTPADSPLLRRPDLLRSLLGFWHNHPSLSYLFSGLFVGPTSQAPRLDEARNDQLYELEIAFKEVPDHGPCPYWLVDRLFRHLLVDVTGNTHRAEFCIDKLYSPDGTSGRRGLLEMRAFEMPPHPRMSLVQQLLLRGLIACFWKTPYTRQLVRWGTDLHDRYLLPHFVEQDFRDVLTEMRHMGCSMRADWFAPHLEFRFPPLGAVTYRGVQLELRQAIEPWHVLGEEQGPGGTARYVDSSVERLQVKLTGLIDSRHVVACNGRPVPLQPTGTNGEFVAGVRYRAWQPPACLHPTVPVHTPLVFDVFDTWLGRSLGGCAYHVAHPGGLSYERYPVNGNEAESRRANRFVPFGQAPGLRALPPLVRQPEFPLTLDLRRETADKPGNPGIMTRLWIQESASAGTPLLQTAEEV